MRNTSMPGWTFMPALACFCVTVPATGLTMGTLRSAVPASSSASTCSCVRPRFSRRSRAEPESGSSASASAPVPADGQQVLLGGRVELRRVEREQLLARLHLGALEVHEEVLDPAGHPQVHVVDVGLGHLHRAHGAEGLHGRAAHHLRRPHADVLHHDRVDRDLAGELGGVDGFELHPADRAVARLGGDDPGVHARLVERDPAGVGGCAFGRHRVVGRHRLAGGGERPADRAGGDDADDHQRRGGEEEEEGFHGFGVGEGVSGVPTASRRSARSCWSRVTARRRISLSVVRRRALSMRAMKSTWPER